MCRGVCRDFLLQVPFRQTVEGLVARPWAVDNLDAALDTLTRPHPYTHTIAFTDNAGADAVLGVHSNNVKHICVTLCVGAPSTAMLMTWTFHLTGMLPFTRELLRRGTRVSLAANETPSINDITAAELQQVQHSAPVTAAVPRCAAAAACGGAAVP